MLKKIATLFKFPIWLLSGFIAWIVLGAADSYRDSVAEKILPPSAVDQTAQGLKAAGRWVVHHLMAIADFIWWEFGSGFLVAMTIFTFTKWGEIWKYFVTKVKNDKDELHAKNTVMQGVNIIDSNAFSIIEPELFFGGAESELGLVRKRLNEAILKYGGPNILSQPRQIEGQPVYIIFFYTNMRGANGLRRELLHIDPQGAFLLGLHFAEDNDVIELTKQLGEPVEGHTDNLVMGPQYIWISLSRSFFCYEQTNA